MATVYLVAPAGLFSVAYDVLADGVPKGRIAHRMLSLRDEAEISSPGGTFTARRERVFRAGAVLLSAGGTERAAAERESTWRERYRVRFDGSILFLRQKLMSWRGLFQIFDGSDEVGRIQLEKLMSRRMIVEYTAAAPPPLEITGFLVWIVLMVQRRQASD
jgi:hypothetical protein